MKNLLQFLGKFFGVNSATKTEPSIPSSGPVEVARMMLQIQQEINDDPDAYLTRTDPLTPIDFGLMGQLVQNYCYADLNARRVIDAIKHAALGSNKRNAGGLQDKQVFEELQKVIAMLPQGDLKTGLTRAASTIEMHVQLRHFFAHWAGRRVKGHDALVLFTKNGKEAEKKSGLARSPEHLIWVVVPLAPLRGEMLKLEGQGFYLASQASQIELDHEEWKSHFDKEREAARLAKYEAGKTKRGNRGPPT